MASRAHQFFTTNFLANFYIIYKKCQERYQQNICSNPIQKPNVSHDHAYVHTQTFPPIKSSDYIKLQNQKKKF